MRVAFAFAVLVVPARAADHGLELVPEINAFFKLSDRTRLYLLANVTKPQSEGSTETEVGANLDFTLMPILRRQLRDADWERSRYLWMRVGYLRLGSPDAQGDGPIERRAIIQATARVELPQEVWLASRAQVDLRDLGGEFSKRFRYRVGIEREFTAGDTVLVPYAQAEIFYDSRFDAWNRQLYQVGVDIEFTRNWRIEPYVARQDDSHSSSGNLNRVGLVLKYSR